MKKAFRRISFLLLPMLLWSACSPELRPFTSNVLREGGFKDDELKKIQFYVSNDIVLQRRVTEGGSQIQSGAIKMVRGEQIEEIVIRRGTPGVFLFRVNDDHFAVSFDEKTEKRYLMFGPNPKRRGTYVLLASNWEDRTGKVRHNNAFYFTDSESALASLLVDLRNVRKVEVNSETARGRTVK